ncbi:hypothetical protein D3C75_1135790 [compost metagenome]
MVRWRMGDRKGAAFATAQSLAANAAFGQERSRDAQVSKAANRRTLLVAQWGSAIAAMVKVVEKRRLRCFVS